MKKSHYIFLSYLVITFILVNCATKNNPVVQLNKPLQEIVNTKKIKPEFIDENFDSESQKKWVDSIYNQLSLS